MRALRNVYARSSAPLAFGLVLTAIIAPKAIAWLLPVLGACAIGASPVSNSRLLGNFWSSPAIVTALIFSLIAFASGLWSASPIVTISSVILCAVYLISAVLAANGVACEERNILSRLSFGFVFAVFLGAIFLLFELATENLLQKIIFSQISSIRPDSPKHIGMANDRVAVIVPDELNRGIAVLNLTIWPALLILAASPKKWLRWIALMLGGLAVAATMASPHESSKVAIVFSLLAFACHSYWPRLSVGFVAAGWLAATLFVVPMVERAYQAELHTAEWLPVNARARVILWAATAERIRQQPLIGIGANATREVSARDGAPEKKPDHVIAWKTGAHAHNVYLQTWYELGLLGCLSLLAVGLALLRSIAAMPLPQQRYCLSCFVSAATIGAFSWGMWQPWLQATVFLAIILVVIAISNPRLARNTSQPRLPPSTASTYFRRRR